LILVFSFLYWWQSEAFKTVTILMLL